MSDKFIPVNDLKLSRLETMYVNRALQSGFIGGTFGSYIQEFEGRFADWCGTKYAISSSNGTTALQLATRAAGITKGDEVIVNAFTNIASLLCIVYNGAKPVLVDSRMDTWSMDESKVADKITRRTKAIMPVHIYGHPVKMDTIMDLARGHRLMVIEDAAEAHGATFNGRKVGTFGQMGCFSFLAGKIITSGEGGMIVTNDKRLADKMRSLRSLAFGKGLGRFMHVDLGYNFRMTNVQAAIGAAQMRRANALIAARRRMASWYNSALKGVRGLALPVEMPWAKNVYWMYGIVVNDEFGMTRNELADALLRRNIDSRPFFTPMNKQKVLRKLGLFRGERYPVAEYLGEHGMYLPSGYTLTRGMVERISKVIKELAKK